MIRAVKATSIVAAAGAAVLGVGLIGFGTGVGANFADSASGTATISTGSLSCGLSSTLDLVKITNNGHQASISLPQITSSAPGTQVAPLTVTNTGQIPLDVTWATTTSGNILGGSGAMNIAAPPSDATFLAPGKSSTINIGFVWDQLQNSDEGRSGAVTYKASCDEVAGLPAGLTGLTSTGGGSSYWDGEAVVLQTSDSGSGAVVHVSNPPATLPVDAPTFATDFYESGAPRMQITFNETTAIAIGYPVQAAQGTSNWHMTGVTGNTWNDITNYATANNLTVRSVYILMDGSATAPATAKITCVNYSGTAVFGSC